MHRVHARRLWINCAAITLLGGYSVAFDRYGNTEHNRIWEAVHWKLTSKDDGRCEFDQLNRRALPYRAIVFSAPQKAIDNELRDHQLDAGQVLYQFDQVDILITGRHSNGFGKIAFDEGWRDRMLVIKRDLMRDTPDLLEQCDAAQKEKASMPGQVQNDRPRGSPLPS